MNKLPEKQDSIYLALLGICESLCISRPELVSILKVCPGTFLNVYNSTKFSNEEEEKVLAFVNFYVNLSQMIPSHINQKEWLRSSNKDFNDNSPFQFLVSNENGLSILSQYLRDEFRRDF